MKVRLMCVGAILLYPFARLWFLCKENSNIIKQFLWTVCCGLIAGCSMAITVSAAIVGNPIVCVMASWCYFCSAYAGLYDYNYISRRFF